jgi:HAD superfamily hydrolase (TIGR01509 family)
VDGTLSETEETHRLAFNQVFREEGFDWSWDRALYTELLKVMGGKERLAHYISAYRPEFTRRVLDAGIIPDLHRRKTEIYTGMVAEGTPRLRPGIARMIEEARAEGLKVAIATTTSVPNIVALLDATLGKGAMDRFDAIAAGDMVETKKPAPDVFLLALEKLGLPAECCIAFEDTENGVLSAKAAGIPSIATPSIYTADDDFSDALAVVSVLGDDDAPAEFISGAALDGDRVTIDQLRKWLAVHLAHKVEA